MIRPFGTRFFALFFCVIIAAAIPPRLGLFLGIIPTFFLAFMVVVARLAHINELITLAAIGAWLFAPLPIALNLFAFFLLVSFLLRVMMHRFPILEDAMGMLVLVCITLLIYYLLFSPRMLLGSPLTILEDMFLSLLFCGILYGFLYPLFGRRFIY